MPAPPAAAADPCARCRRPSQRGRPRLQRAPGSQARDPVWRRPFAGLPATPSQRTPGALRRTPASASDLVQRCPALRLFSLLRFPRARVRCSGQPCPAESWIFVAFRISLFL
ncbi:putative vegetative cell wall protein gp1-like isoform X3 [Iris pallida]|uniref:Vegetative cell wall protein gp1-like isoform X3 n=1 Tax=Iris pallida TaxID=29817 RepID=A0AAX6E2I8_IRIPA|nr:putative vegetative cell wall protein gp1-like isoform X3 [Iris pallida]